MKYDLIILGGGPAGTQAAERAAQAGQTVLLFEPSALGGVCLNEGCIPTKTLLVSARTLDNTRTAGKFGVVVPPGTLDMAAVQKRRQKVVRTLAAGLRTRLKKQGVTVLPHAARLAGRQDGGFAVCAGEEMYYARHVLLATGSQSALLPICGLRQTLASGFALTSREALLLQELPASIVIVGAGVIGLEFASFFCSCGCEVTMVEALDHIAGAMDEGVSAMLMQQMARRGVRFMLSARAVRFGQGEVEVETHGQRQVLRAEKALFCIGRTPNVQGLGLETLPIEVHDGAIVTDAHMQTTQPGVYACGDVTGRSMLAHTAHHEAEVAVAHMLGGQNTMNYGAVPAVLYTNPEAACVGLTEQAAREDGRAVRVLQLSMRFSGRFVAENEGGDGVCRLVVENGSDRIVGVHLLGNDSAEIIALAVQFVQRGMTLMEVQNLVFAHPTVAEVLREAAFLQA